MTTYALNNERNGIEITFAGKPAAEILSSLKSLGFRWHSQKKLWYAKQSADRLQLAKSLAEEAPAPVKEAPAHGVKVGDIFYTSWGYEQTNVNFFQVVELIGKSSARIIEVHPAMAEETAVSGMSADRCYTIPDTILPADSRSSFLNDPEKGDIRRIKISDYDGSVAFKVGIKGSYQDTAHPYHGQKLYESWYY